MDGEVISAAIKAACDTRGRVRKNQLLTLHCSRKIARKNRRIKSAAGMRLLISGDIGISLGHALRSGITFTFFN
jgi:hypothetical protein